MVVGGSPWSTTLNLNVGRPVRCFGCTSYQFDRPVRRPAQAARVPPYRNGSVAKELELPQSVNRAPSFDPHGGFDDITLALTIFQIDTDR